MGSDLNIIGIGEKKAFPIRETQTCKYDDAAAKIKMQVLK